MFCRFMACYSMVLVTLGRIQGLVTEASMILPRPGSISENVEK